MTVKVLFVGLMIGCLMGCTTQTSPIDEKAQAEGDYLSSELDDYLSSVSTEIISPHDVMGFDGDPSLCSKPQPDC